MERKSTKKTAYSKRPEGRDSRGRDKDLFPREVRRKFCRFCQDKIEAIDYKDITRLSKFLTDRKKILSRRISGNCAKHQRKLSHAMKRARFLAFL